MNTFNDSCFYGHFSHRFYRKHFSAFIIMSMCCDHVIDFLRLSHSTDLLYQFSPLYH